MACHRPDRDQKQQAVTGRIVCWLGEEETERSIEGEGYQKTAAHLVSIQGNEMKLIF